MNSDTAFVRIARPVAEVFAFVTDPAQLSRWSFGTWRLTVDQTGLICGTSIKDGATTFVRIQAHPGVNLVDFLVGSDPETLIPRIFIRLAEGATYGRASSECALMMTSLRAEGMDDDRWASLKLTHAFEVSLIKSALETGYDHRAPNG